MAVIPEHASDDDEQQQRSNTFHERTCSPRRAALARLTLLSVVFCVVPGRFSVCGPAEFGHRNMKLADALLALRQQTIYFSELAAERLSLVTPLLSAVGIENLSH